MNSKQTDVQALPPVREHTLFFRHEEKGEENVFQVDFPVFRDTVKECQFKTVRTGVKQNEQEFSSGRIIPFPEGTAVENEGAQDAASCTDLPAGTHRIAFEEKQLSDGTEHPERIPGD